jgi:hypothetical protein
MNPYSLSFSESSNVVSPSPENAGMARRGEIMTVIEGWKLACQELALSISVSHTREKNNDDDSKASSANVFVFLSL